MLLFTKWPWKKLRLLCSWEQNRLCGIHSFKARQHFLIKGKFKAAAESNCDHYRMCLMFRETLSLSDKRIFPGLMNNLVSPDGGSQTSHLSLIRPSSTSLPTLRILFFFFHQAAGFTIPLIQLHHGNACHLALCVGEHNLVVWSNCWSLSTSLDWEGKRKGELGEVDPLR